jgi:hypothetical protein
MRVQRPEEITSFPPPRGDLSPEELAEVYALVRASFTAEDLQCFTEVDEGIPFDEVLAELEKDEKNAQGSS